MQRVERKRQGRACARVLAMRDKRRMWHVGIYFGTGRAHGRALCMCEWALWRPVIAFFPQNSAIKEVAVKFHFLYGKKTPTNNNSAQSAERLSVQLRAAGRRGCEAGLVVLIRGFNRTSYVSSEEYQMNHKPGLREVEASNNHTHSPRNGKKIVVLTKLFM